jgi:hypothetical protein
MLTHGYQNPNYLQLDYNMNLKPVKLVDPIPRICPVVTIGLLGC